MKIAVCIHVYHGNMWDEIESYLKNLKIDYDLYVNLPIKNEFNGNVIPVDFNWVEYLELNPDLRAGKVKTEHLATRHYLRFGIRENRRYSNITNLTLSYLMMTKPDKICLIYININVVKVFLNFFPIDEENQMLK